MLEYDYNLLMVQLIIIVFLLGVVIWFVKVNKISELERRYKKFCLEPLNDNSIPILSRVMNFYNNSKIKLSKYLIKSHMLKDYSKKYEKYIDKSKILREDSMNYISAKVIWGFLCIIIIILSDVLRYVSITFMQVVTVFLIGFFVPDIYWHYREKVRKNEIEKDMLKAIIIMNNSFKSGLSIMQAIYMVSNELDGAIADEFKKMYIDISFGLDMDLVFKRFANRVNTEEAKYITTSLSVLNKTGGNIVQVFTSVERSAFTRKKLKEELGALSASANAIYKILIVIPVLLSLIILLLNPKYFTPLFSTSIGRIICGVILTIYIAYVIIIRKIINMRG